MPGTAPRVRTTSLEGLAQLLKGRYQVAIEPLLEELGIDLGPPDDPASHMPLAKLAALLEIAAARAGDACLGLAFADAFPRGASGVIGYLMMTAPNLRASIACLSRYARLQSDAIELHFVEAEGIARLTWTFDGRFLGPRKQLTEFMMGLFMRRARSVLGRDWTPLSAEFEYREPPCRDAYVALFGPSLHFGAGHNRMTAPANVLARPSVSADERLFELLRAVAERELEEHSQSSDIQARVAEKIVRLLPIDGVDLERAAGELGVTSRQLQSRLRRQGTSFEAELVRVRRRLAERYLCDTDMSMTDIALVLGFSELSAFTRAARGWFGMPPTAFREHARRVGGVH